jgi:hypothetical protein
MGFLQRLENHARLASRSAEMLYLHRGPDGGAHALVRLTGPLGIERTARTDLRRTAAGSSYVAGRAAIGASTKVYATWTIDRCVDGCIVTVSLNVISADLRDRLLLRLGAHRWLTGRLKSALEQLTEELAPAPVEIHDQPRLALAERAA